MKNNKGIILGKGEIGNSLLNVLSESYPAGSETFAYDIKDNGIPRFLENKEFGIMHVCFPYSDKFKEHVSRYKKIFNPEYTVIHSTVPVGTSKALDAVHSPVVGLHPNLEKSLLTFNKFLGGEDASEVADYFRRTGMRVYLTDKSDTTEYMKIMSTTFYGIMIEMTKQVKKDCDKMNLPFELFTLWNINYNEGYEKLGFPEYKKPLLTPVMKNQGGHCTIPNTFLLDNAFTNLLKDLNTREEK